LELTVSAEEKPLPWWKRGGQKEVAEDIVLDAINLLIWPISNY